MKNNDYTKMIKDLHAPATAVEQALQNAKSQIYTVSEQPPVTFFEKSSLRLSRRALIAASVVFACALSVSVFFLFGNKSVPIAQSSTTGATLSPTGTSASAAASDPQPESKQSTGFEDPNQYPTQVTTDSEGHTVIITIIDTITSDDGSGPAEPSENSSPTQSASKPTEGAKEPTTEKNTEMPSEPVSPTSPECTVPEWPSETDDPDPGVHADIVINVRITGEIRNKYNCVYCRIYDESGSLMGGGDLYSYARRADINKNYTLVSYFASKLEVDFPQGVYTYIFYTPDGEDFSNGQIEVYE